MPETLIQTSTDSLTGTPTSISIEALPATPVEPPRPGNPFEERPPGTSTTNETATQDSGSGG